MCDFVSQEYSPTHNQILVFVLETLLVPHYVVGLFAWHWFSVHPWICSAIMVHCVWATQREVKTIFSSVAAVTQINWRLKIFLMIRCLCMQNDVLSLFTLCTHLFQVIF